MTITPKDFLDALEIWKKQATILITYPENEEISWEDIMQDMEDFASENVVE